MAAHCPHALRLAGALSGCLARVPEPGPGSPAPVATVPAAFFAATPVATCCPAPGNAAAPPQPPGRYTLGAVTALPAGDRRAAYAAPLLGPDARFVQIALRIDDLTTPRTPEVAYELVTAGGVFAALADGEWEGAVADARGYHQDGTLLFVVPLGVRAGRLDIVDYYYPRAGGSGPATLPLVRRVAASFSLTNLP